MTSDVVRFPAAAVRGHAAAVDAAADEMRQARAAVREVTMDVQAYGVLCNFLPLLLTPVFELAVNALDGSIDALGETATELRMVAAMHSTTDRAAATLIQASAPAIELPL